MLVSKDGQTFFNIDDTTEELETAKSKGYSPYQEVTKDGSQYFTLAADVKELNEARKKGYVPAEEWDRLQELKKEPSAVQFGPGEAFTAGVAEEGTLGGGKYAIALGKSLMGGSSFKKELEALEYQQKQLEQQQGLPYLGGRITGGVATGLATGAIAPAATAAKTIAKGAAVEGVTGALTSLAQSEAASSLAKGEEVKDVGNTLLEAGVTGVLSGIPGGMGAAAKFAPAAAKAGAEVAGEVAREAKTAVLGAPALASSAQKALIEAGRRTEGAGYITKQIAKISDLATNIAENYSNVRETAKLARELRKQMGEEVANMGDRELIAYVGMLPGENPVKRWQAIQIAKATNGNVDEVMQALVDSPDIRAAAELFDPNVVSRTLADDLGPVATDLKKAMTTRYGKLLESSRASFEKQPAIVQDVIQESVDALLKLRSSDAKTAVNTLMDAASRLSDVDTTKYKSVIPAVNKRIHELGIKNWEELTPQQQFDNLINVRRNLDAALKGVLDPSTKKPIGSLNDAENALYTVRKGIDSLLKSAEDMAENDATYKAFKPIDSLFNQLSIRGSEGEYLVNPAKIMDLFKDTKTAETLQLRLDVAKDLLGKLPAEEAAPLKPIITKIEELQNLAEASKKLEQVAKHAPKFKKSQETGLAAAIGDSLTKMGVTNPAELNKASVRLISYAEKYLGKSTFDKLAPTEKRALLEMEAKIRTKKLQGQEDAVWQTVAKKYKLPTGE